MLRYFFLFIVFTITFSQVNAQQCNGSLGEPIINFTFGAGSNPGAALSTATTAYQYVPNDCPNDGSYTVRNNSGGCFGNTWHVLTNDHTGNTNGYFMLVNARVEPSAFYIDTVRGLCSNSTYEFAAWIMNVNVPSACGGNTINPDITFTIEKVDGTILQSNTTNNIATSSVPTWKKYSLIFNTPSGVSNIVLRMTNNAAGGCGNDLALDDITFRACGPSITNTIIGEPDSTSAAHCEGILKTYNFSCSISTGLNNPSYQWQQSINNGLFTDMLGENNFTLNKTFLTNNPVGIYKYRLAVAEAGNINSISCRTLSKEYVITINKKPITTASNTGACQNKTLQLNATGGDNYTWTGPNNFTATIADTTIQNIQPAQNGKYYVLVKNINGCTNLDSTTVIVKPSPLATNAFIDSSICEGNQIKLIANGGIKYEWIPTTFLDDPAISSPTCKPTADIKYKVAVSNVFNCSDTAYCSIKVVKKLEVDAGADIVTIANKNILLKGTITGDFLNYNWYPNEFINNVSILNPMVNPPTDKKYYLTASNGCYTITDSVYIKMYNGIFIPNTFTPNGDNKNDTWNIPALEAYPSHELKVYNRYGEIVFERKQSFKTWDGKYKGETMPVGVYVYIIDLKNGSALLKGTLLLSK